MASTSSVVSATTADIQRYLGIIQGFLKAPEFAQLSGAPNIQYVLLATIGLESGWQLYFNKAKYHYRSGPSGSDNTFMRSNVSYSDAAGYTPTNYSTGSLIGKYWDSPSIKKIVEENSGYATMPRPLVSANQGRVPMGLMQTMGCYHVTDNAVYDGGDIFPFHGILQTNQAVITPAQMASGVLITDIFSNRQLGEIRSILMGMVIFASKYASNIKNMDAYSAVTASIGNYVGVTGRADSNGYTPADRINAIVYAKNGGAAVSQEIFASTKLTLQQNQVYATLQSGKGYNVVTDTSSWVPQTASPMYQGGTTTATGGAPAPGVVKSLC